jgi:septum formation protein
MLHLASQSPRRRDLLALLRVDFRVIAIDIAEQRQAHESAEDYVRRVAMEKACAGLRDRPDARVLGADTEVVLDDEVFGKPRNAADAAEKLRRLSARTHRVLSAVSLGSKAGRAQALSMSQVSFAPLDEATIAAYVASGEPEGKAGAYAIQGIAQAFITHLSGSYSGVWGLPLHETALLLAQAGVASALPLTQLAPAGAQAPEAGAAHAPARIGHADARA